MTCCCCGFCTPAVSQATHCPTLRVEAGYADCMGAYTLSDELCLFYGSSYREMNPTVQVYNNDDKTIYGVVQVISDPTEGSPCVDVYSKSHYFCLDPGCELEFIDEIYVARLDSQDAICKYKLAAMIGACLECGDGIQESFSSCDSPTDTEDFGSIECLTSDYFEHTVQVPGTECENEGVWYKFTADWPTCASGDYECRGALFEVFCGMETQNMASCSVFQDGCTYPDNYVGGFEPGVAYSYIIPWCPGTTSTYLGFYGDNGCADGENYETDFPTVNFQARLDCALCCCCEDEVCPDFDTNYIGCNTTVQETIKICIPDADVDDYNKDVSVTIKTNAYCGRPLDYDITITTTDSDVTIVSGNTASGSIVTPGTTQVTETLTLVMDLTKKTFDPDPRECSECEAEANEYRPIEVNVEIVLSEHT